MLATAMWFATLDKFDANQTLDGTVALSVLKGQDPTVPVILQWAGQMYIGFSAVLEGAGRRGLHIWIKRGEGMKYSSKDVVLLIDGYNVLGEMTELTHAAEGADRRRSPGLGEIGKSMSTSVSSGRKSAKADILMMRPCPSMMPLTASRATSVLCALVLRATRPARPLSGLNGALGNTLRARGQRQGLAQGLMLAMWSAVSPKTAKSCWPYRSRTLTETPNPLRSTTAQRPQVAPTCICRSRRLTLMARDDS